MHIIERPDDPALQTFGAHDAKVIELFAGPGGMSEGAKLAGLNPLAVLGIENDRAACETATAAGHPRYLADIDTLDPRHFGRAWGLHGSPPCPGFSAAGTGEGRRDLPMLALALKRLAAGEDAAEVMAEVIAVQHDPRSALSLEPMVWLMALRPEWVTLEQVPAVLPLWGGYAAALRQLGYNVWTGIVSAETVGVPQTRKRAVLLGSRTVDVSGGIRATHSRYHTHKARRGQLDSDVLPYVTMAEALEWGLAQRPSYSVMAGGHVLPDGRGGHGNSGGEWGGASVRKVLRETRDSGDPGQWVMRSNYGTGGDPAARGERTADGPAPTVTSNKWTNGEGGAVRVTVREAGILQSFRADYPWRGTQTQQYQQVGNAVPPLLGQAMIETVLGRR